MTKIVTLAFSTLIALPSFAHPLQDAAAEATRLCQAVDADESLMHCGSIMGGRSPEHSAARKAVMRMFNERNAYMASCRSPGPVCGEQADLYIGSGMYRVLITPAVYLDAPLPPRDMRR